MVFVDSFVWTILIIISVVIIGGSLYAVWVFAAPPPEKEKVEIRRDRNRGQQVEQAEVREQGRDALGMMRRRNRPADDDDAALQQQENVGAEDHGEERVAANEPLIPTGALGKKKLKKLQEKEEKARMREALDAAKKEKNEREDREIYERKKKQAEEAEKERKEEEELEKIRLERKRKEEEEYQALKHMFSVESDGSLLNDYQVFEQNIEAFISYVKERKVVFLEDLASKYHLKTQVIVDKINALESDGRLSGIIDERGKFIYISAEEMTAVSRFIKIRGRVSISEIQRESNNLINLNPTEEVPVETEPETQQASS